MSERIFEFLSSEGFVVLGLGAVLALSLFWLLRERLEDSLDVPTVSNGNTAPTLGYRNRMVAASVAGAMAIAIGAYLAVRFGILLGIPLFAVGFATMIGLGRTNRKYRHASPTMRRLVWINEGLLNGSLLAGVLIVSNVLAFKYGGRPIDLSLDRAYSLESLTRTQIRDLDASARFIVFAGSSESAASQLDRVRQLLRLFEAENPDRIQVEYLDPFTRPERARELVDSVPGLSLTQGGGVIVEYGEGELARRVLVRNVDMFQLEADETGTPGIVQTRFLGEAALTTALIRLVRNDQPLVAFTTGHGEASINTMEPSAQGYGLLRARLEQVGMRVIAHNPNQSLPDGLSTLVVAAPETPMNADEVNRIQQYVEGGGRLVVLLDQKNPTGLEDWLKLQGIQVDPGLVVDPTLSFRQPMFPLVPVGPAIDAHPLVAPLQGRTLLFPYAAPLTIDPSAGKAARLETDPVLRTSVRSWAESEPTAARLSRDADRDRAGPITVAAAVAAPAPTDPSRSEPRLVLFSSRYVGDNLTVASSPANLDLIVNALSWLQRRPDLAGVAPRTYESRVLTASPNLRAKLVILPTLLGVLILVGLGIATYLARRE